MTEKQRRLFKEYGVTGTPRYMLTADTIFRLTAWRLSAKVMLLL